MFYEQTDFLSEKAFNELKRVAKDGQFKDEINPIDGVAYPLICTDVPEIVRKEVEFLAEKPAKMIFLRRSPEGVLCPNLNHHDASHGKTSFMLYLGERPGSGTAFVSYRPTGSTYAPEWENVAKFMQEDSAELTKWELVGFCEAKPNKACMFDSRLLHAAYPIGGYGEGEDARCVLTAFF